jgi:hypothetical protein
MKMQVWNLPPLPKASPQPRNLIITFFKLKLLERYKIISSEVKSRGSWIPESLIWNYFPYFHILVDFSPFTKNNTAVHKNARFLIIETIWPAPPDSNSLILFIL